MNLFNSVKGLHPRRNKFTADTYRNDFTAPLGVNIPSFILEVPPATRIKCSASALVRLQALIAPVMDNVDYYTHFWKIPYRLLENDRFTKFISGEIEGSEYDALFCTPHDLSVAVIDYLNDNYDSAPAEGVYNLIFGNGSLLDMCGYDSALFAQINAEQEGLIIEENGNTLTQVNWRPVIAYFMLHVNWYMNENVPYFDDFVELVDNLVKDQSIDALANLLVESSIMFNTNPAAQVFVKIPMLPHGWDKDYFTSALPNVQYGDPVTLNLTGTAPVYAPQGFDNAQPVNIQSEAGSSAALRFGIGQSIDEAGFATMAPVAGQNAAVIYGNNDPDNRVTSVRNAVIVAAESQPTGVLGNADLSEIQAITINELRFANALQVFKERQLRFGRRRLEYYKGFFDVEPEDLRLQVPKYLGGGRIPINIADIEQTSATSGSSALGRLAGKATAIAGGFAGFSTFCSEESIIIGISFAIPHITYAQQLSRFRLKTNDIYDYFNPSFEHLGEQAIKNVELFSGSTDPEGEFAYTPRYAEYRFHLNEMHGEFKSSLSYWSLGRVFSSQPALNPHFVYMQPQAFDRIFAVKNQPNMIVSMLFHIRAIKPVSKYGTPMLLA